MHRILLFNLILIIFGCIQINAQSPTDSLTKLINKEKSLSEKNALYLKRSLTFPPDQKEKAFDDISNARKFYLNQKDNKGLVDADLTLADYNYSLQNYKDAVKTDSIALLLAEKIKYEKGIAQAHGNLGRDFLLIGNFPKAENHLETAIKLQENFKPIDHIGLSKLYNHLSIVSKENGRIAESLNHIEKAIELTEQVNDKEFLIPLYLNKGIAYTKISKFELSIQNSLKAVELSMQAKDDENLFKAYNNLAVTYKNMDEYEKSIYYYIKGMTLAEQTQDYKALGLVYMNLANVYVLSEQVESLDTLYHKSIKNFEKINDLNSVAMAYHNFGNYYIHKEEYGKAEEKLLIALELRRKNSPAPSLASSLSVLGNLMLKQNKLAQAEKYLLEAEKVIEGSKGNKLSHQIYTYLKVLYATKKDYTKAFHYQEKELEMIREIYNENEKVGAMKAQTDFDLKMQEYEHDLAKKEQEKRQLYLSMAAGFIILVMIIILIFTWQRRKQIRQKHESELIQIQQKHRIDLADSLAKTEQNERKKIAEKLHDETVGILSIAKLNVEQLSEELFTADSDAGKKLETAKKLLNQASDSIRDISHTLMPIALGKYGLKQAIEDLIISINTSKTIKIESLIEGLGNSTNWDSQFNLTIYRMVHEVFNNIIKHAHATNVLLQIMEFEDSISIYIEDNGKGIETEANSEGIGLTLLKKNIEYFNGNFEINGSQNKGTLVLAELPILMKIKN